MMNYKSIFFALLSTAAAFALPAGRLFENILVTFSLMWAQLFLPLCFGKLEDKWYKINMIIYLVSNLINTAIFVVSYEISVDYDKASVFGRTASVILVGFVMFVFVASVVMCLVSVTRRGKAENDE